MATLKLEILAAAHKDGLLPKRLTANQKLYLHSTVITANAIYWEIANAQDGLDMEQLEKKTEIHFNTLLQFCRWFRSKELIECEKSGAHLVYFTKRRHLVARRN